jgi:hypothetical protein
MTPAFIDHLYIKYKLKKDERMLFIRTVASTGEQLFEAPFDPSLVYPSPFVIGYIQGQSDRCLELSEFNLGFWLVAPFANLVGLKQVSRYTRFLSHKQGRYAARDLKSYFDEGYRAGESDFYNQQLLRYGQKVNVHVDNLRRHLTNEETNYEGKGKEVSHSWFCDERRELLIQLKKEHKDSVPVDMEMW